MHTSIVGTYKYRKWGNSIAPKGSTTAELQAVPYLIVTAEALGDNLISYGVVYSSG